MCLGGIRTLIMSSLGVCDARVPHEDCQIFLGKLNQNGIKYAKLTTKYTKRPLNTPNVFCKKA
jgi:hypothetical protein